MVKPSNTDLSLILLPRRERPRPGRRYRGGAPRGLRDPVCAFRL